MRSLSKHLYCFVARRGLISCYKGYYASNDTAGVGRAANSAVMAGLLAVFLIDLVAVLVSTALGLI